MNLHPKQTAEFLLEPTSKLYPEPISELQPVPSLELQPENLLSIIDTESCSSGSIQGIHAQSNIHIHETDQACAYSSSEDSGTQGSPSPFVQSCNGGPSTSRTPSEASQNASQSSASSLDTGHLPQLPKPLPLKSFKLVGDNIDKEVRPREMRQDYQTRSLHFFHTYAVKDQIDLRDTSDEQKDPNMDEINLQNVLPNEDNDKEIRANFQVLICRILVKYIPFFSKFKRAVERHIPHQFSEEVSHKSEVVCCTNYK